MRPVCFLLHYLALICSRKGRIRNVANCLKYPGPNASNKLPRMKSNHDVSQDTHSLTGCRNIASGCPRGSSFRVKPQCRCFFNEEVTHVLRIGNVLSCKPWNNAVKCLVSFSEWSNSTNYASAICICYHMVTVVSSLNRYRLKIWTLHRLLDKKYHKHNC